MSTATEISRLTEARNTIRDKLVDLGLAASTDKLDVLATAIDGIANRGAVSATVQEGDTYTIPAGYHNGSGTVSGVSGGGNYTLQSKTVTPTKSQQSITPDSGYYGLSDVTVAMIPEAYQNVSGVTASAADVLSPKVIVDATGANITGTMANNGAVSRTLDASTGNQSYTVPAGYHNGSGSVNIVLEEKSATPTTSTQNIVPTAGKVLSKVTIAAIPSNFADVSNDTVTADSLLYGVTAHIIQNGVPTEITGTIPSKDSTDVTTSGATVTIPAGYYGEAATVSVGNGSATTPATTITANPTISVNTTTGVITATASASQSVTPTVSAGYVSAGTAGTITVSGTKTEALSTQAGTTITPTESEQTAVAANKYTLGAVKVAAIPSNYVGSNIPLNDAEDIVTNMELASGAHLTASTVKTSGATAAGATSINLSGTTLTGRLIPGDKLTISGTTYTVTEYSAAASANAISGVKVTPAVASAITSGTSVTVTVTEPTVTAPYGYYSSDASITVQPAMHNAPTITVSSSGLITASHTQGEGYVTDDSTKTATQQLTGLAATTYHPSANDQTITSGKYITGTQTIKAVELTNLTAANIKTGVTVKVGDSTDDDCVTSVTGSFTSDANATAADLVASKTAYVNGSKITGEMVDRGTVTRTLDATTGNQSYTIPAGKHSGSGTVSIVLETKTVTPTTASQSVTPTSGKVLSQVTVNAIPAVYGDTTNDTATAAQLLAGATAHTLNAAGTAATAITGTMPNNGAISGSIDGLTTTSYSVPAGYTSGGSVSLTNDIELALAAIQ